MKRQNRITKKGALFTALLFAVIVGVVVLLLLLKPSEKLQPNDSDQSPIWQEQGNEDEAEEEEDRQEQFGEKDHSSETVEGIEQYLETMTLEEKIYQLFIVTPEQLAGSACVTNAGGPLREALEQKPVAGLIYFAYNLNHQEQTKKMLDETMQYGYETQGLPLFLCVDEEGGRVTRISGNANFHAPQIPAMASIRTITEARNIGSTIGSYLKELGFNWDFAPVADVLTVEDNFIKDRSFGSDAQQVKELAIALSDGLKSQGIMSTFKHFPGHGATTGDTHEGFSLVDKTYEELMSAELVPFAAAQKAGVDAIMVAHVSAPKIIGDNTPCTLSKIMITDILRGDLGYEGLIITDAMGMGAITENYSCGEATVKAIEAGVDLILMPQDLEEAYQALYDAVQEGRISEERLDQSLIRILKAKRLMCANTAKIS